MANIETETAAMLTAILPGGWRLADISKFPSRPSMLVSIEVPVMYIREYAQYAGYRYDYGNQLIVITAHDEMSIQEIGGTNRLPEGE